MKNMPTKIKYRTYIKENKADFFEWFDTFTHHKSEDIVRSRKILEMYCDGIKGTTVAHHFGTTKQNIDWLILRNATKFYYAKN